MKQKLLRTAVFLLALLLCLGNAVSCASGGKALMTLKKDGISVSLSANEYQLLLSRMKGSLYFYGETKNGMTADQEGFWSYLEKAEDGTNMTLDELYKKQILENCKTYLAALYLFEANGLSLTETQKDEIEAAMTELIRTDGEGSKTKLNATLSAYGVNYNILENFYETELKLEAVKSHLYGENASMVSDTIKNDYMNENYVHFRQIFLPSYTYVCKTDENDDVIYFRTEDGQTNRIYYDSANGESKKNEDGSLEKDENGDVIYYVKGTDYTKIAYNIKGKTSYVMNADGTDYKTRQLTADELAELETRANTLFNEVKDLSVAEFEAKAASENQDTADAEEYSDGYYLRTDLDYTASGADYAYLDYISKALITAEVGDVILVPSNYGYHIVRKYANTDKAYALEANESWFDGFYDRLIDKLFLAECEKLYGDIKINEKVLEEIPPMKEIGLNYYY